MQQCHAMLRSPNPVLALPDTRGQRIWPPRRRIRWPTVHLLRGRARADRQTLQLVNQTEEVRDRYRFDGSVSCTSVCLLWGAELRGKRNTSMPTPRQLAQEVCAASPSKSVEALRSGSIGGPSHPAREETRKLESLSPDEVSKLLQHLNLEAYVMPLRALPMTGADLAESNVDDLKDAGVSFRPHRTRLFEAVQELKSTGVGSELLASSSAATVPAAAYTRTATDDACSFNFLLADKIRGSRDERLPSLQHLRRDRPDWLVAHTITRQAACDGSLVQEYCVISHRWETPTEPDTLGEQLKAIRAFLDKHHRIRFLWIGARDYA